MQPRWVTVQMAATEFGVSDKTVYRWLSATHEAQVPRQHMRIQDDRGRFAKKIIVEFHALAAYEKTIGVGDTPQRKHAIR